MMNIYYTIQAVSPSDGDRNDETKDLSSNFTWKFIDKGD